MFEDHFLNNFPRILLPKSSLSDLVGMTTHKIKKDINANAGTKVSGSFIALIINSIIIYWLFEFI